MQLLNSDTWRSIFLRTLVKGHSNTHRSYTLDILMIINCCKIAVLENGDASTLNY